MNGEQGRQFVDASILVYAHEQSAGNKHAQAKAPLTSLWRSRQGCLSVQVLQEFYVTVTRKVAHPLPPAVASQIIADLGVWRVHRPAVTDILDAITLQTRYQLSFWDAMILQSAIRLECALVWSEDLKDGQNYYAVQIQNPLRDR